MPSSHFGGQANTGINSLSVVARDRYISKIQCILGLVGEYKEHCLAALDPYRPPDAVWVDDTSKIMASSELWPPVANLYSSSEVQIASVLNNEKAGSPI